MNAHLEIRDLVKSYDGASRAVDQIRLDVSQGEFLTFLGPSGSGKTTTLMMIAGFERASGGKILLEGVDIAPIPPFERNVGMVFQNYALFPHMSAADNIAFPLKMRKFPKADIARRVKDALDMVNLGAMGHKLPKEMSGGQQQRVALARAMVFEPDLLLLDEPLGALDKNLREQMQLEIKRLHRETGMTMIYVTHDQTEAMTMSDRVAVFNNGRIEQIAPPLEIYQKPRTHFVADFIGDNNQIEGQIGADRRFTAPGFSPVPAPADCPLGRATLTLRPESIGFVGINAGTYSNTASFEVGDIVHYGDSMLVLGHVAGKPIRVRSPARLTGKIEAGSTYTIGWNDDVCHFLSDQ